MAMGGAFVGLANDPSAVYWNPAGLGIQMPGGLFDYSEEARVEGDLTEQLEQLGILLPKQEDIWQRPGDALRARNILRDLESKPASLTDVDNLGLFASSGTYSFSIYRMRLAEARPVIDLVHVEASTDPETSFANNESTLDMSMLDVQNYDFTISSTLGDPRLLGGLTIRYMKGKSRLNSFDLFELGRLDATDVMGQVKDSLDRNDDSDWSWDVGVLIIPSPHFQLGVVGKWLNSPGFRRPDQGHLKMNQTWRAGLAVFPHHAVSLSIDFDLNRPDAIDGVGGTRALSAGAEVAMASGVVRLRGGLTTAISGGNERRPRFAMGMGLMGGGFVADVTLLKGLDAGATSFAFSVGYQQP
jgi:hypothetical protein